MEDRNYVMTDETIEYLGHVLHRIKCTKAFSDVEEGEVGGFIESYDNLKDNAWVADDAKVYGDAIVADDAEVYWYARVDENAKVYDNAKIGGSAHVFGEAKVYGNAYISGEAEVYDCARVCGNSRACDNAKIGGDAILFDNANVIGNSSVFGYAEVGGNAIIYEYAKVGGNVVICNDAQICGNAIVKSKEDYIVFKNWWSSGRQFTWTRSNNMWKVGCFYGSGEELIKKAYKDSKKSGREYERIVKYVESINENVY